MYNIGSRIKKLRKAKKMTQLQLATQLGVEQSAISNYENNFRMPTTATLSTISSVLGVSTDYLLGTLSSKALVPLGKNIIESQQSFLTALIASDELEAEAIMISLVQSRVSYLDIFTKIFIPTLHEIGERWSLGEMNIAQEHYITAIMDRFMGELNSLELYEPIVKETACFILPGAEEHELGLKMAALLFKQHGWKTYYFGKSLPVSHLEAFLKNTPMTYLVMNVTMKIHLNSCETLVQAIKSFDTSYQPKILLSGVAYADVATRSEIPLNSEYVETLQDLNMWIEENTGKVK